MTFFTIIHGTKDDPQPEEAGRTVVTATIINEHGLYNIPFTTTSLTEEFIDVDNHECRSKQDLYYFLMEARLENEVVVDAMVDLDLYVDELTSSVSNGYFSRRVLQVWVYVFTNDDHMMNEAVQDLLSRATNIRSRHARKFVVKSLTRKIYNKTNSVVNEECTICLEEFKNGTRVVTLPCGHDFDDGCIVKWFETSLVCPLCRFELPSKRN